MQIELQESDEEAVRVFMEHWTKLAAQICAIVRDVHVAEDLTSEVKLQVLRSWAKYDPTRPFYPWAWGFARLVILCHQRKAAKIALLNEAVMEKVVQALDETGENPELDRRKDALDSCITRLPSSSQEFVKFRFTEGCSYEEISARTGRSKGALQTAFNHIRTALEKCVTKKLKSL